MIEERSRTTRPYPRAPGEAGTRPSAEGPRPSQPSHARAEPPGEARCEGERWSCLLQVGQDAQVAAPGTAAVVRGVARRLGTGRLADGVGEGQQVVAGGAGVVQVDLVPHDLPAAGHGQALG